MGHEMSSPIDEIKIAIASLKTDMANDPAIDPLLIAAIFDFDISILVADDLVDIPNWEGDISHSAAQFVADLIDDAIAKLVLIAEWVWDNY